MRRVRIQPGDAGRLSLSRDNGFYFPLGHSRQHGDGIKMATEAGAALWHMATVEWGAFCARKPSQKFGTAVGPAWAG